MPSQLPPEISSSKAMHIELLLIELSRFIHLLNPHLIDLFSGENVHLTVLATHFSSIETGNAQYQCYSKDPADEVTLVFGRTAPIPSASAPDPPPAELHSAPVNGKPMLVWFTGSSWDTDGFGAFYCSGYRHGLNNTTVSTFFTRSDGK